MSTTPWLAFENMTKFGECGLDIRKLNSVSREVLDLFIRGQVEVSEFLRVFPLPGGSEPAETALCLVRSFAPAV
jgi:hypothetical protein